MFAWVRYTYIKMLCLFPMLCTFFSMLAFVWAPNQSSLPNWQIKRRMELERVGENSQMKKRAEITIYRGSCFFTLPLYLCFLTFCLALAISPSLHKFGYFKWWKRKETNEDQTFLGFFCSLSLSLVSLISHGTVAEERKCVCVFVCVWERERESKMIP